MYPSICHPLYFVRFVSLVLNHLSCDRSPLGPAPRRNFFIESRIPTRNGAYSRRRIGRSHSTAKIKPWFYSQVWRFYLTRDKLSAEP